MKKLIPILFMFFMVYSINHKEEIIIPDYAIRFRVIANSNTIEDQEQKIKVKNALEKQLNVLMAKAQTSEEAKQSIQDNLNEIRKIVNDYNQNNTVNFGNNYFPQKEYHGITYKAGNYESLVVTLGNGQGKNWWCVMFPPLCLLEAKDNNTENIEYKSLIKEILNKYSS